MQGDFRVNEWLVQPQINAIEKDGKQRHLEPKVMQVLVQLSMHANEVVTKEHLLKTVWRDLFVGDDVIVRCISEIRYALGDKSKSPRIIQTIPKAGYRLIANVALSSQESQNAPVVLPPVPEPPVPIPMEPDRSADSQILEGELDLTPPLLQDGFPAVTSSDLAAAYSASQSEIPLLRRFRSMLLAVSASLLLVVVYLLVRSPRPIHASPISLFWGSFVNEDNPVLICIADQPQNLPGRLRDAVDPERSADIQTGPLSVTMEDLNASMMAVKLLQSYKRNYTLKAEGVTNLNDLRQGQTVFVGAFDNAWTLRISKQLRFHFWNSPDMSQLAIVDASAPANLHWSIDRDKIGKSDSYTDYALVGRFTSRDTGQPALIVGGLTTGGTLAAGEFISEGNNLHRLQENAPAGSGKSVEAVLSTHVIDGQPGPVRIEAVYYW
ncbi:winged helix-turn-helix domain-containing protein [Silvibacterium acidisoli]|uniref:winged helix-turn-helix domain-containing protein n=1 Tax=Acidobacteriaceae bacterium ZG23-2 TaxID=2883246 RepID=UPI00406CE8B3